MSRSLKFVLVGAVVALAAAVGGYLWFFSSDPPAAVDLDAAVEALEDSGDTGEVPVDGIEGSWTVDADSGTFDYSESASSTYVGFRVGEELVTGPTEAVGRTPVVTGSITIEGTTLAEASFEADLSAITTDRSARNGATRRVLGTDSFPTATFVLTEAVDLGAGAAAGGPVSVTAVGDLTIKGVTRSVEFALDAQLVGGTVIVTGTTPVVFADYGVDLPTSPRVVSIEDNGVIEVQLLLTLG